MSQESRVRKSLLNARVNLIFYFLTLALSFFSRKIFLDTLGADFVGLTSTLQNLLGFLNLAELGISTAIGYVLYKPLFEQNKLKINEIISVFGYLYHWIGKIMLLAGGILACFLSLIFSNTGFDLTLIFFVYFSFLISTLIGYFINYKQTLLGADQKNYVVTAYFQTVTIIKTLIQIVLAYYTKNYYLWVVIELLFGFVYSIILNWKIRKVYPWLHSEVRQGKYLLKRYPEVIKYTKQLFVHKIGGIVQYQTTPVLIYSFISLKMVAYYGNYSIIIDKVTAMINSLFTGMEAGIGNLIAEGNPTKIQKVFWEINALRYYIAGFTVYAIYQCLMIDVDRYREFELKPLERMKTANRKSGTVGDIDLWENGRPIEAVEIKYEVHVGVSHVSEAIQKVQTESVERYFILSTVKPDPNEWEEVQGLIEDFLKSNGCEIIVNGVYETIKYYLRLLKSTNDFVNAYTELLAIDEDINYEHKVAWNAICAERQ